MVGDWTNQNPDITEVLVRYERAGVPMYLYFPPGSTAEEGQLLPQILTPGAARQYCQQPGPSYPQRLATVETPDFPMPVPALICRGRRERREQWPSTQSATT